jgi:hypothetical protein
MGCEKDRVRVRAASLLSITVSEEGMTMPKWARAGLARQNITVTQSRRLLSMATHLPSGTTRRDTDYAGICKLKIRIEKHRFRNSTESKMIASRGVATE